MINYQTNQRKTGMILSIKILVYHKFEDMASWNLINKLNLTEVKYYEFNDMHNYNFNTIKYEVKKFKNIKTHY